ncbi:hypothetical protein H6G54_08585 [Anabaena cylindrica FACHB-243]|uniref:Uncharacterized protein n=1 Tax=Anabaena cylindrica (strain ATCC 27899 / PCC 7122) TaxID=272123 RepID=K9ZPE5_ANACC|nr:MULTISPECIES: hypothetical protein [Anabaena]AFZ60185.1 hypothetical protein Anacy_4842 [Anabaena cylindrica PCC 7122]MBD2417762.1 hypothetical protein [Anabaena cylindrica FACHB-243]MBY5282608.1 hypothetical protein [Anabaena sp. CCAP 1446/1C]MBY5310502.1 hypothetical protein [Anabaena sp. CCAP 1446/1C]MCM2404677.1 hypothetical protein [Anabaena sp. CCAP 1446/1C]
MTNIHFTSMNREQLREYVKTHPEDQAAFYTYMDRLQTEPGIDISSIEQFDQVIEEKLESIDIKDAENVLKEALQVGFTSLEELKKRLG